MCYSLGSLRELVIAAIIVCAIIAIIQIVLRQASPPPWVAQLLNVIMWVLVAIVAVKVLFDLFACIGMR